MYIYIYMCIWFCLLYRYIYVYMFTYTFRFLDRLCLYIYISIYIYWLYMYSGLCFQTSLCKNGMCQHCCVYMFSCSLRHKVITRSLSSFIGFLLFFLDQSMSVWTPLCLVLPMEAPTCRKLPWSDHSPGRRQLGPAGGCCQCGRKLLGQRARRHCHFLLMYHMAAGNTVDASCIACALQGLDAPLFGTSPRGSFLDILVQSLDLPRSQWCCAWLKQFLRVYVSLAKPPWCLAVMHACWL